VLGWTISSLNLPAGRPAIFTPASRAGTTTASYCINAINRDKVDEFDRIAFLLRKNKLVLIQIEDADDSISDGFNGVMKSACTPPFTRPWCTTCSRSSWKAARSILDDTEEQMIAMEEDVSGRNIQPELNENICLLRNRMSKVKRYYDELVDVGEVLQEDEGGIFGPSCKRFLSALPTRPPAFPRQPSSSAKTSCISARRCPRRWITT
jgi:hypothetical protein